MAAAGLPVSDCSVGYVVPSSAAAARPSPAAPAASGLAATVSFAVVLGHDTNRPRADVAEPYERLQRACAGAAPALAVPDVTALGHCEVTLVRSGPEAAGQGAGRGPAEDGAAPAGAARAGGGRDARWSVLTALFCWSLCCGVLSRAARHRRLRRV
jgi:hypothetical protein